MKILVCGGRRYGMEYFSDGTRNVNYEREVEALNYTLNLIHNMSLVTCIVHGAASGADALAGEWADRRVNVSVSEHKAQWHLHGRAAGPLRNQEMLELHSDVQLVVGFSGGAGTQDMLSRARTAGILTMHIV